MTKSRSLRPVYKLVFSALLFALIGGPGSGAAMNVAPPLYGIDADGHLRTTERFAGESLVLPDTTRSQQPATAQMSEGFESAWPATGWQIVDNSTADGGEYLLGKRTCHPRTGSSAGWMVGGGADGSTLGCAGNYPNNVETWAFYGPIDLSKATSASLRFHVWGRTEAPQGDTCYDGLFVGSFTDDTDLAGGALCGDATGGAAGNGYYQIDFPLDDRLGASEVWLAFAFVSDGSTTDMGFTTDDVSVDVTTSSPPPSPDVWTISLPFIAMAPAISTPPSGTAFDQIKKALGTSGSKEVYVLDTSRCTFNSASGWMYFNGVTTTYDRSQVESKTRNNLKIMTFRISTGSVLADYKVTYLLSPMEISYPAADRLRLHAKLVPSGTNLLDFTGDVMQNEMQIDYSEDESTVFSPQGVVQYGSEHLEAELRCPLVWQAPSEWTPLRVSNVQAADMYVIGQSPPNRCLRVSWDPAPTGLPAASVNKYELTLVGYTGDVLGTVEAPATVAEFLDCSQAAQQVNMCNNPSVSYRVVAVSSTGKKSLAPIPVLHAQIWRPCGFLPGFIHK